MFLKGVYSSLLQFCYLQVFWVDPQADFDARPVTFTQFNSPFIYKQTGSSCVLILLAVFSLNMKNFQKWKKHTDASVGKYM